MCCFALVSGHSPVAGPAADLISSRSMQCKQSQATQIPRLSVATGKKDCAENDKRGEKDHDK